jgi:hypothetical protein
MRRALVAGLAALLLPSAGAAQLSIGGRAGYLDRRLSQGGAIERQAGVLGGVTAGLQIRVVSLSLEAEGATLAAQSPGTPDADYARLAADLAVAPSPWVALEAGVSAAVYVSDLGSQRWVLPHVGLEFRAPFRNLPGYAYLGGHAIVGPTTNAQVTPGAGIAVRGGVAIHPGPVALVAEYRFERLSFEEPSTRQEQSGAVLGGVRIAF